MTLSSIWRDKIRRIRYDLAVKAVVLMYHRVADLKYDPWQLAVSPKNFEQHLQVLKKNYNVVSAAQLVGQINEKSVSRNSVCITFDDGYSDNFLTAKPLLEKYDCPAVFFISTHFVSREQSFWWDQLQQIILESPILPAKLSININEKLFEFDLENDEVLTDEQDKKQTNWVWTDESPTRRCRLYLELHSRIKHLLYAEICSVLEKIKHWADGGKNDGGDNLPMTGQQLRELSENSLFDIGLHTVTHPFLPSHSRETQLKEIAESKTFLQSRYKKATEFLAYPYGAYNEQTLSVVKEQGLTAAFTTEEQPVTKYSEIYRLSRFQVKNWNDKDFEKQLLCWKVKKKR